MVIKMKMKYLNAQNVINNTIHSDSKLFKCTYANCKDSFNRLDHLKSHAKLHENNRLFLCDTPS